MSFAKRSLARRIATAGRNSFRALVFVCVCASLWQAPVPWLHHHCKNANNATSSLLALHLQSLHKNGVGRATGWHLHFVMLDDIVRGSGLPIPPSEGDAPVLPKEHVVPGDSTSVEVAPVCTPALRTIAFYPLHSPAADVMHQGLARVQFLGDLASPLRLHLVLCVARC
jgi:hypothetical protein